MLKVEVINKIEFPKVTLQEHLEEIAERIIIPDIKSGIGARMAINGGQLPPNKPSTIKRKGHDHQLIDTGELKESFSFNRSGKFKVIISIDSGRREIAGYLQNDGVGKEKKKYVFFGISKDAYDRAMDFANSKVKEMTRGSKRGS